MIFLQMPDIKRKFHDRMRQVSSNLVKLDFSTMHGFFAYSFFLIYVVHFKPFLFCVFFYIAKEKKTTYFHAHTLIVIIYKEKKISNQQKKCKRENMETHVKFILVA